MFKRSKNYLDHNVDCEDVPVYKGHSLINTTKHITLLYIVQSLLHCYPLNIWIKIIQIVIQMECLQIFDSDSDLDNFAPCKWGISEFLDEKKTIIHCKLKYLY